MYPAPPRLSPRAVMSEAAAASIAASIAAAAAAASLAAAGADTAAAFAASAAAAAEAADAAAAAAAPHMSSCDSPAQAVDAADADAHEPLGLRSSWCAVGPPNGEEFGSRRSLKRMLLGGIEKLIGLRSVAPYGHICALELASQACVFSCVLSAR
jgi:hypothetical protein